MGRARRGHENQMTLFQESPHTIIDQAWREYGPRIIRRTAMLSGGDDSSTLAHWLATSPPPRTTPYWFARRRSRRPARANRSR